MSDETEAARQVRVLEDLGQALRDAVLRSQDLLDELEDERIERWPAYAAFREVGAVFRSALEQLRSLQPGAELQEVIAAYSAGAYAGLEAAGDLAEALQHGEIETIELGIQRLTLAGQQFVRARYLLHRRLPSGSLEDAPDEDTLPPSNA